MLQVTEGNKPSDFAQASAGGQAFLSNPGGE